MRDTEFRLVSVKRQGKDVRVGENSISFSPGINDHDIYFHRDLSHFSNLLLIFVWKINSNRPASKFLLIALATRFLQCTDWRGMPIRSREKFESTLCDTSSSYLKPSTGCFCKSSFYSYECASMKMAIDFQLLASQILGIFTFS